MDMDISSLLKKLQPKHLDALKEVGNIGSGNAATSLSQLLNKKVDMKVPYAKIMPIEEIPKIVGGADKITFSVFMHTTGDLELGILFIIPIETGFELIEKMLGKKVESIDDITELESSVILELGTIMSGTFLSAFTDFVKVDTKPSVPDMIIDMAGSVLDEVLIGFEKAVDYALLVETMFKMDEEKLDAHVLMLFEPNSLIKMMKAMHLEVEL
jgi:chemotaxis protein CheC